MHSFHAITVKVASAVSVVLLVLVPFHAFLTVWASTLVGHFTVLRLWDEMLLAVLVVIVSWWLVQDASLRATLRKSWHFRLILTYGVLYVVAGLVAYGRHDVTRTALLYSFVSNGRFLVWFLSVWLVAQRSAELRNGWPKLLFLPMVLVCLFAVLQTTVLPRNFLTHFGYGPSTYVPYVTINQDNPTIRAQSFLRGANPLGAYLAAVSGIVVEFALRAKRQRYAWALLATLGFALFCSFSRSGWIGAVVAGLVCLGVGIPHKAQRLQALGAILAVIVLIFGGLLVARDNTGVQDALLHVSSRSTAVVTSNEGHAVTFRDSLRAIAAHPLGMGPGTAGQASWYNTGHGVRNTESYFLQIGAEVGVVGLLLFFAILGSVGFALWRRRSQPLALGLFASLWGLLFVGQFSYAWNDVTLAFVWWGLAGIALAYPVGSQLTDTPIKQ